MTLISEEILRFIYPSVNIWTDFNVYMFPACARVIMTSIKNFGGKRMQCDRRERHFSSKCSEVNVNEM